MYGDSRRERERARAQEKRLHLLEAHLGRVMLPVCDDAEADFIFPAQKILMSIRCG